jgi:hypothetical protein
MGMVDDLRIEEAVQQALAASAEAKAMALVQLAADPKGCKQRIEELTAATKAHDDARAAAEQAIADAETKQADAESRLRTVAKREAEFLAWQAAEKARLRQADLDARAGETANAQRAAELAAREAALRMDAEKHSRLIARMRAHVAEVDAA